jgi:hypothetical protein
MTTPQTDAAAKQALARLESCKSANQFNEAVKAMVKDLLDTARKLEVELVLALAEIKTLRETPVGVAVTQAQRLGRELGAVKAESARLQKLADDLADRIMADPPLADAACSAPVLRGEWRHSHGMIFCGTLRIAKADFDTNPHPDFCARVFDDICRTMNETQNAKVSSGD